MYSSQNTTKDVLLKLYQDDRTVFRLNVIAMLTGESDFSSLNQKMNYYVQKGKILNPRKGIYAKPDYSMEEMACTIYYPSYLSLEYVLQRGGLIFQYDSSITSVCYLRRDITVDGQLIRYRRIKESILLNSDGIVRENNINIASIERAFLDILYLEPSYYFDNLNPLEINKVNALLPLYSTKALNKRVKDYLK